MVVAIEKVRGFREVYPEESEPRKRIFETAEKCSVMFGFRKIEMPSVENLELYRAKSGNELLEQCFSFLDRGGRELTLTPEATPTVARMIGTRKDLAKPVRWYSFQRFWRYEEPQSGRQREFYQLNADIFGPDSAEADGEVAILACTILNGLGLEGHYDFLINDRILMDHLLTSFGFKDRGSAFALIDKFKKMDRAEFENALGEAGLTPSDLKKFVNLLEERIPIESISSLLSREEFQKIPNEVKERIVKLSEILTSTGFKNIFFDLSVVRGLAYYTGMVFEVFDTKRKFRSIVGGGRYDSLVELYSGARIPATGFAMGDATLELLLRDVGKFTALTPTKSYFIAFPNRENYPKVSELLTLIRSHGIPAMSDVSGKSFSAQIRDADREGCTHLIVLGDKEIESGTVTIKNLSTGEQETVSRIDFLNSISL